MAPTTVSIVILSWNSKAYLGQCLDSARAQTHPQKEILVIDNGSVDGSAAFVRERYPNVRLITHPTNVGFARGNNVGITNTSGEYVMALNSDVVLDPLYIETLHRIFDQKGGKLGMASGKLFRPGSKILDSTGLVITRLRRFADRGSEEEDKGQYDGQRDIFGACAAAAIFRRRMLEDIRTGDEYFDEDFFAYVEDVDLAWRARRLGWSAAFVPEATATHVRGGSNLHRRFKQAFSFRNRYWMMLKNESIRSLLRDLPFLLAYDISRFFYLCLTNPKTLPAAAECLLKIPKMLRKRTPSQIPAAEIRKWMIS